MRAQLFLFLVLCSVFSSVHAEAPAAAYGEVPSYRHVAMSPDGNGLALLRTMPNGQAIVIHWDSSSKEFTPLYREQEDQAAKINWVRFASNDRVLIGIGFSNERMYGRSWIGQRVVEVAETRMVSIKTDGSEVTPLLTSKKNSVIAQFRDQIIDMLPHDAEHVLIQLDPKQQGRTAVYKLNIVTGRYKRVQKAMDDVTGWTVDGEHRVRIGFASTKNRQRIIGTTAGKMNWRTLWEWDLRDGRPIIPIGFGEDPNQLYVRAAPDGFWGIYTASLSKLQPRLLPRWVEKGTDVGGSLIYSNQTGSPIGAMLSGDGSEYVLWDKQWEADQAELDKALPDRENFIVQTDADDSRWLIYSSGIKHPGEWRVFDRDNFQLQTIGKNYARVPTEDISVPKKVSFKARDGLKIPTILTLPKKPYRGMPTVILPHGGPHEASQGDSFSWLPQFLASRGYAVIEPNFRGSTGQGVEYEDKGLKQWGLTMQNDVTDATRWAIDKGISDPERVCIVGASYGGYAALMGVAKEQGLYQCAAGFAGVYDLLGLLRHAEKFDGDYLQHVQNMVGDRWKDSERLKATSPARQAENINVPVLLLHGDKDLVVPDSHSIKMHKALKRAKKEVRYVPLQNGDHGLSTQTNRVTFLKELELFLAQHLN